MPEVGTFQLEKFNVHLNCFITTKKEVSILQRPQTADKLHHLVVLDRDIETYSA
jgi:hypothetical protein